MDVCYVSNVHVLSEEQKWMGAHGLLVATGVHTYAGKIVFYATFTTTTTATTRVDGEK